MAPKRQRIAVLGSTGSIGCNALEVIEHLGSPYEVVALAACSSVAKLAQQAAKHRPRYIGLADQNKAAELKRELPSRNVQTVIGEAIHEIAGKDDVDVVLAAIVGAAGLAPVLTAVRAGKRVALANKESLVIAGSVVMAEARRTGAEILPVDSEHSAVFQAIASGRKDEIARVIITASGGPFRNASLEQIENATVAEALNHPTWSMGGKITIDSATMFNKALEVIEACWLFDLPAEKIEVVVHPESIVHSMVEFTDGSTIAQLSPPDMRLPIQYALTYPERRGGICRRMDWTKAARLTFEPPDLRRFPALRMGFEAAKRRGTSGAVLNAANEVAVAAFLSGRIRFGMIQQTVHRTIQAHEFVAEPSLEQLLEADRAARQTAETIIAAQ